MITVYLIRNTTVSFEMALHVFQHRLQAHNLTKHANLMARERGKDL